MKLTAENYEFILFELLENNLNEEEKQEVLAEIEANAFYKKEWDLMQNTLLSADTAVVFPQKSSLLKPAAKLYAFTQFNTLLKVAASLLLIGLPTWYYLTLKNTVGELALTQSSDLISNPANPVQPEHMESNLKLSDRVTRSTFVNASKNTLNPPLTMIIPQAKIDTPAVFNYLPVEMEYAHPDAMPLKMTAPEVSYALQPELNPLVCQPALYSNRYLEKALQYRSNVMGILRDIPNLQLKVTPKLKDRNIDFELKGDLIYANALLELKK